MTEATPWALGDGVHPVLMLGAAHWRLAPEMRGLADVLSAQIESVEQAYESLALDAPPRRVRTVKRARSTTPPRQSARPR